MNEKRRKKRCGNEEEKRQRGRGTERHWGFPVRQRKSSIMNKTHKLGVVGHACNPNMWDVEARG